ncbi:UDP-N-acetylglucosamine 1-carboxyvinyltransferase [Ruminococcaceae bacterium OttesenSCG-928-L11]|nr:UDP-N-acetylglucosamine 1-carboxyvinyltransferase [Ruminococcaceae bacterium OttesenSCG-928-L11]
MEKFVVEGNTRLEGEVTVGGAKNAAVALIPAAILAKGVCVLENVPNISDVSYQLRALTEMGGRVRYLNKHTVEIDTSHVVDPTVPYEIASHLRASYYFLGALIGRFKTASVSMPGGCNFGVRPIDQHIKGFESLGCDVTIDHGMINASVPGELTGSHIYFDVVTVGATINVMLAAARAKGLTILENAAKEPHIVDLANFLNSMGADIRGAGTDVIKIHGVDIMHGSTYSVVPDQIEAGTYMVAAAATFGDVLIKNIIPKHMESLSDKLVKTGAIIEEFDDAIRVSRTEEIQPTNIKTMPHPGFPTDLQPQMGALLAKSNGTSVITEGVTDNRYRYVEELTRMGANIQVDGKVAVIQGVERLTGAQVRASDLRAGVALIIAAFMADGDTEIEDIHFIDRGYEDVVGKLRNLGANIRRIDVPDSPVSTAL